MHIHSLTFITGNPAKAEQLGRHLEYPVAHHKLDLPEIQSLDLREIIDHKAKEAYKEVKAPVLVEDTALAFTALGRLPGALIKWFLTDLDNVGLCKLLDSYSDRSASAKVCFGLYDGKNLEIFEGSIEGTIAETPRGERGFGWDPIFIPEGYTKTWGEMSLEEQRNNAIAHSDVNFQGKKIESGVKDLFEELSEIISNIKSHEFQLKDCTGIDLKYIEDLSSHGVDEVFEKLLKN